MGRQASALRSQRAARVPRVCAGQSWLAGSHGGTTGWAEGTDPDGFSTQSLSKTGSSLMGHLAGGSVGACGDWHLSELGGMQETCFTASLRAENLGAFSNPSFHSKSLSITESLE